MKLHEKEISDYEAEHQNIAERLMREMPPFKEAEQLLEFKIIQFRILLDVVGIAGAGNNHHALLEIPPENHLGGGHAVVCGNPGDHLVSQQLRRVAPASSTIGIKQHPACGTYDRRHTGRMIFLIGGSLYEAA